MSPPPTTRRRLFSWLHLAPMLIFTCWCKSHSAWRTDILEHLWVLGGGGGLSRGAPIFMSFLAKEFSLPECHRGFVPSPSWVESPGALLRTPEFLPPPCQTPNRPVSMHVEYSQVACRWSRKWKRLFTGCRQGCVLPRLGRSNLLYLVLSMPECLIR